MAPYTAQILIGRGGGYDNQGIIPAHIIYLSENSRPAWVFNSNGQLVTWIPTIESMLEDGLLMLNLHLLPKTEIHDLAGKYFKNKDPNWVELYEDIAREHLLELYRMNRNVEAGKIILSVFKGSSIRDQLHVL